MDNELKSLDAVEREIRARYNGKYQSAPEYQASERAHVHPVTLFCDYRAGEYITRYH